MLINIITIYANTTSSFFRFITIIKILELNIDCLLDLANCSGTYMNKFISLSFNYQFISVRDFRSLLTKAHSSSWSRENVPIRFWRFFYFTSVSCLYLEVLLPVAMEPRCFNFVLSWTFFFLQYHSRFWIRANLNFSSWI